MTGVDVATQANLLANLFASKKGVNYPAKLRLPGWVDATDKDWWARLVKFVESNFALSLQATHLRPAIRKVKYGIHQNPFPFNAMLERYNPDSRTFYTPVGELGLALHEMHVVFGLSWGNIPYEERYIPLKELDDLKRKHKDMYETHWKMLCDFHVCLDSQKETNRRKGVGYLN